MIKFRFKDEEYTEDFMVVNTEESRIIVKFINENGSKLEREIPLSQLKKFVDEYKKLGFNLIKDN